MNDNSKLTEVEQLKLENFNLKHNILNTQVQSNWAARAAFIKQVEADHPGYSWDDTKGLIEKPDNVVEIKA